MRPRRTARIGASALRTLAALLLVDGRTISARDLAEIMGPWPRAMASVEQLWVPLLRRHGCWIETGPAPKYGYRLAHLPPDALLEDVLVIVHLLRAEQPTRLWARFGRTTETRPSRTRARAS